MKGRYLSLDLLRGITIFGMVFSAIIPYGVLPAWMYHIQNPPPTHELNMSIAGLSWVDLVFPLFIFCMGVAIPLSGIKRIEKGITAKEFTASVLHRFLMLWLFSYLYVFITFTEINSQWAQALTICGFISLFPLYGNVERFRFVKSKSAVTAIRVVGLALCCLVIYIGHVKYGEVITLQRRGIIIFLLAFLYLFGSLIWFFTRQKRSIMAALFALLFLFTLITQGYDIPARTYAREEIRWWFNIEYIYFLMLLIPAIFTGEILYNKINNKEYYKQINGGYYTYLILAALVVWNCYALYLREIKLNLVVSFITLIVAGYLIFKKIPQYRELFLTGALFLLWVLIMDPLDDGIRKVPCTISYCFSTFVISIFLLMICDLICKFLPHSLFTNIFSGAGKNPLMSYVAYYLLIIPIIKLAGVAGLYEAAYLAGDPMMGIARAAVAVLFTMWIVSLFSKKNIYWKA